MHETHLPGNNSGRIRLAAAAKVGFGCALGIGERRLMSQGQIAAIITAFNPNEALREVVTSALSQCSKVVLVDNSPGDALRSVSELNAQEGVQLIRSGKNTGLAGALNAGVVAACGSEYLMLLDQDSKLLHGTVASLAAIIETRTDAAVVAPVPWDEHSRRYVDPRASKRDDLTELDVVITSGMLLRSSAFKDTDGFREDFFVDCVDQDFCLQLRARGWKILQDRRVLLPHSLGETRWHGKEESTWIRSTSHPTWRLYWMARNGMTLSREYLTRQPRWALMNLLLMLYVSLTVLAFEPPRWKRWSVFMRGIGDGLFGRRNSSFLPEGAVDAKQDPPNARMGGVKRIAVSTLIAGALGYVVTTVIARTLGAGYAEFAVYWSGLYLVIGALSGIQQEFARGMTLPAVGKAPTRRGVSAVWVVALALLAVIPVATVGMLATSTQLFESHSEALSWAMGVGIVFQTVLFAVTGFAFARHAWTPLAWVIVGEITLRLVLVGAVAISAPSIVNFAWASVIPFPVVTLLALSIGPLRQSFSAARFDARAPKIMGHISQAIIATVGSAALTNGVPLVIAMTGRADNQDVVSTVILALILTRGPIVVGVFAFQSYLVVYFRRLTEPASRAVARFGAGLLVTSVLLAVAAALVGPQLLEFFAGPSYQISAFFISVLTLTSISTGVLAVTGSAALGNSRHGTFVAGWMVGAVSTIGMLFLPLGLELRVLIALGCGPLLGVVVHLVGLARARQVSAQSMNASQHSVFPESGQ